MSREKQRTPKSFDINDPSIMQQARKQDERDSESAPLNDEHFTAPFTPSTKLLPGLFSWGTLLLSSLLGLAAIAIFASMTETIRELIGQTGWTSRIVLTLIALTLLAATALILKDLIALSRLSKLTNLKQQGRQIHQDNEFKKARKYTNEVLTLYAGRKDLAWPVSRIKSHDETIMDAKELIELLDHELGLELDRRASTVVTSAARKVSLITAVAPGPLIDMAAVAFINIRMIRDVAEIYGVQPGFFGSFKLIRRVIAHLALTGGISLTSDLLSPLIGSTIAAKLSRRLGEGVFNGGLTIRIGMSVIEVSRPIPHVGSDKPQFKSLITAALTGPSKPHV